MKKKTILMAAVVATTLASCGGGGGMPNFGDNEYPVEEVKISSTEMQTTYPATINGIQDVEIRPKMSGFLTQINVTEGQTVQAGQVLFVIDNETYQAAVRQAQASVNTAQSAVNTAKLTYENSKQLFDNRVIGEYELQMQIHSSDASYGASRAQNEAPEGIPMTAVQ